LQISLLFLIRPRCFCSYLFPLIDFNALFYGNAAFPPGLFPLELLVQFGCRDVCGVLFLFSKTRFVQDFAALLFFAISTPSILLGPGPCQCFQEGGLHFYVRFLFRIHSQLLGVFVFRGVWGCVVFCGGGGLGGWLFFFFLVFFFFLCGCVGWGLVCLGWGFPKALCSPCPLVARVSSWRLTLFSCSFWFPIGGASPFGPSPSCISFYVWRNVYLVSPPRRRFPPLIFGFLISDAKARGGFVRQLPPLATTLVTRLRFRSFRRG